MTGAILPVRRSAVPPYPSALAGLPATFAPGGTSRIHGAAPPPRQPDAHARHQRRPDPHERSASTVTFPARVTPGPNWTPRSSTQSWSTEQFALRTT
jgi:hypothetical protein